MYEEFNCVVVQTSLSVIIIYIISHYFSTENKPNNLPEIEISITRFWIRIFGIHHLHNHESIKSWKLSVSVSVDWRLSNYTQVRLSNYLIDLHSIVEIARVNFCIIQPINNLLSFAECKKRSPNTHQLIIVAKFKSTLFRCIMALYFNDIPFNPFLKFLPQLSIMTRHALIPPFTSKSHIN